MRKIYNDSDYSNYIDVTHVHLLWCTRHGWMSASFSSSERELDIVELGVEALSYCSNASGSIRCNSPRFSHVFSVGVFFFPAD